MFSLVSEVVGFIVVMLVLLASLLAGVAIFLYVALWIDCFCMVFFVEQLAGQNYIHL